MDRDQDRQAPDWADFRRQMPVASRWAYFDHAAVAPISGPAQAAMAQWTQRAAADGDTWGPTWTRQLEETRAAAARLIGAEPDEIALVPNTTAGISLVAEGYPWQPGDNVVTLANEFPTNQYPWLNLAERGVEVRRVDAPAGRVDLERIEDVCDRNTRILAISWVGFTSGWRTDVDALVELAHRHGALLMLDAIQGLGVFPLDVKKTPVDFLAADGHKWLLGPEGAGVVYVRIEHLERLRPLGVGWNSVVHSHDYDHIELKLKPTAARYEGGTYNTAGFIGLGASFQLLLDFGVERMAARLLEITDRACERLADAGATIHSTRTPTEEGWDPRSGIVSFDVAGSDLRRLRKQLRERDVVLSYRAGLLRISPHVYTNEEDLDRLVEGLLAGR